MEILEHYKKEIFNEIKDNRVTLLLQFIAEFQNLLKSNSDVELHHLYIDFIVNIYLYSCSNGKTIILNQLFNCDNIQNSISRGDILEGITLCLAVKQPSHFRNFIYLIDIFNITIEEVNGTRFNLLQYCVISDNVDALHFLLSKYDIDFNTLDEFVKDLLIMTALHNISRKTIEFLFETKRINSECLNKYPSECISNGVYLMELSKKYGYKLPKTHQLTNKKYIAPQFRTYGNSKKTSYHIFNSRDMNRADKDMNWRKEKSIIVKS